MKKIILFILLWVINLAYADYDLYHFDTVEQKNRFSYLTQQYRCLVCQNETLADSSAPLAVDLKKQIALLIQQGKDDQAITQYLVQRYGDFVLFRPPVTMTTFALWFGPFILLLIGVGVLMRVIRRNFNS